MRVGLHFWPSMVMTFGGGAFFLPGEKSTTTVPGELTRRLRGGEVPVYVRVIWPPRYASSTVYEVVDAARAEAEVRDRRSATEGRNSRLRHVDASSYPLGWCSRYSGPAAARILIEPFHGTSFQQRH